MIKKFILNNWKLLFFSSVFLVFYGLYVNYLYNSKNFQSSVNILNTKINADKIFPIEFSNEGISNIALIMMVKDEADIIFENLVWHFAIGFRKFIIVDNNSNDNTAELIQKFADLSKNHAEVFIIKDPITSYIQSRITTGIYDLAGTIWGKEIDWIFPVDADEFWTPEQNLKLILNNIPSYIEAISTIKLIYNPNSDYYNYSKKFFKKIYFRDKKLSIDFSNRTKNPLYTMNHKVALRAHKNLMISPGNHGASYLKDDSSFQYKNYKYKSDLKYIGGNIIGLHMREFPIRSPEQIDRKFSNVLAGYKEAFLKKRLLDKTWSPYAAQYMEYIEKYGSEASTVRFNEIFITKDEAIYDPMPFDRAFDLFYKLID